MSLKHLKFVRHYYLTLTKIQMKINPRPEHARFVLINHKTYYINDVCKFSLQIYLYNIKKYNF